jgi:hypothetical protein
VATPMRAATLQVRLNNDTTDRYTDVGYYVHGAGLDVVNPATGEYVERYKPEEYQGYDATKAEQPVGA